MNNGMAIKTTVTYFGSNFWIILAAFVWLSWFWFTNCKIFENTVSLFSLVTSIVKVPVPLIVLPKTSSPLDFSFGILSPLIDDSSMDVEPDKMTPSMGT